MIPAMSALHPQGSITTTPFQMVKKTLGQRICQHWRVALPLLPLIACIVGIVYSLTVWNFPYLAIAFGVGALGSVLAIHQAFLCTRYKAIADNYKLLETRLMELKRQLTELQAINREFRRSMQTFKETHEEIKKEVNDFSQANLKITASAQSLDQTTQRATALTDKITDLKKSQSNTSQEMASQLGTLMSIVTLVQKTAQLLSDVKKDPDLFKMFDKMRDLQTQQADLLKEQVTISTELAAHTAEIKESVKHIKRLEEIKEGFDGVLKMFMKEVAQLSKNTQDITSVKNDILKAAKIFKAFQFNSSSIAA